MTFDDGVLKIYKIENVAESGKKPKKGLREVAKEYYNLDTVGITRYYQALQAQSQISNVVNIWQDRAISPEMICILEDGLQYRISFVQHLKEEEGLQITKLTLERIGENYELIED